MELIDKVLKVWNENGDLLRDQSADYSDPIYRALWAANLALSKAVCLCVFEHRKTPNTAESSQNVNQQLKARISDLVKLEAAMLEDNDVIDSRHRMTLSVIVRRLQAIK